MTLSIFSAGSLPPLADHLTARLRTPLPDPMMPELVAVPSVGLQRWLKLHMAATLGASPGAGDGIAANIEMPFPGILRSRLFSADRGDEEDPWRLSRLTFAVHQVLLSEAENSDLEAVTKLPAGATWYGRARRIADLFDRYGTRRPEMIRRWSRGEDLGPTGEPLRAEYAWQPVLFRLVRNQMKVPSPAERLPQLLRQVQDNSLVMDLPPRFSIFGVSTLPGGQAFADILKAFGEHRDIDLYMVDPSPATTKRLGASFGHEMSLSRQDDHSAMQVRQPLLRSWGRASRESQLLLPRLGLPQLEQIGSSQPAPASTLLGALQNHLVNDAPAAADFFTPDAADTSIQIHACTGNARQVEVLRDALLAQLRDDPALNESDILVVCPDLPTFAPLIPGAFGPSADRAVAGRSGLPRLRYTISDRDLPTDDALIGAILALVDLVGGRYQASRILDFLSLPPVADAFMLDADDLDQIEDWLAATEIRWGLNQANRERNDLPGLETNTWRHGLHQLLVGMAINDDEHTMGPGQVPATGVEGGGVATLSRLLSFLARLEEYDEAWSKATTMSQWNERLSEAVVNLFQMSFEDAWQIERARVAISETVTDAAIAGAEASVFSLTEIAQLLVERLGSRSARPRFFDGAITFTSLRPLRWVPHRFIAILGLDESALIRPRISGDDILGVNPDLGDPDQRADQRQALLEVVLSAQDTLLVTRSGRDVKSNKEAPPSIAVAELLSELKSIINPEFAADTLARMQHSQPRHTFDPNNFQAADPFSFDTHALRSAEAKIQAQSAGRGVAVPPLATLDPERITEVRDLHDLLQSGPKLFLTRRLGATFRRSSEGLDDNLPIGENKLLDWSVLEDLIATGRQERDLDPLLAIVARRGSFPAGPAGSERLDKLRGNAQDVIRAAAGLRALKADDAVDIVVNLPGLRLRGQVGGVDRDAGVGPSRLSASKIDERMRCRLWLDLCLLTAQEPDTDWTAIAIAKPKTAEAPVEPETLRLAGTSPTERQETAIGVLRSLSRLLDIGMTEPLPIFAKVTVKNAETGRIAGWTGDFSPSADPYVRTAFGELSDRQLLELRSQPTDPGDPAEHRRFIRLHNYIARLRAESIAGIADGVPS